MSTIIRQYHHNDLTSVLSAWENASKLAHPFLTSEFTNQERKNIPNLYLPNADTWVAEVDNVVVGFIALIGNEVGAIFVQPEFHGKRFGKALMDKAKTLHSTLEVEVFKANTIGRKFYRQYGFEFMQETLHVATGNQLLRLDYKP
ncbi:MAG: GNAT family N-acetyltransferase [Bermanella sp.]